MPEFDPMKAADDFAVFVEAMTGMKNQFIAAGWTEPIAEALVLEGFKAANN